MKKLFGNLTFQVLIAIVLGVIVGLYFKPFAPTAQMISKVFISMITMLIPFIIFFTIVLGIAGMGNVDFHLLLNLLIGSLPGIWVGSHLAGTVPEKYLRPILSAMLIYAGVKLIAK